MDDFPLRWHWEGDQRICDYCHGEVWAFEEGHICSQCQRSDGGESGQTD
jgi:hypothetical protein